MTSAALPEPSAAADVVPLPVSGAPDTPVGPPPSSPPPIAVVPDPAPRPAPEPAVTLAPAALAMIGGFVMAMSTLMPWVILNGPNNYQSVLTGFGLQESGLIFVTLGVITIGVGAATIAKRGHSQAFIRRVPIVIAVSAVAHAVYRIQWIDDWARWGLLASRSESDWVTIGHGLGLYVLILGALIAFAAGCWRKPTTPSQ